MQHTCRMIDAPAKRTRAIE